MNGKNLGLLVASLAFALTIAEVATRLVFDDKHARRPLLYIADDQLGWKPSANLDHAFFGPDYAIHIRTDEMHHRLGSLGLVDHANHNVIPVCGDSYTFGWGVSTHETFASHFDHRINELSAGRIRVVNLGVGGYGTVQSALRVQNFLDALPDANIVAVVMVHSHNDATDNVNSIGFHIGAYESRPDGEKSPFHLINLLTFAVDRLKQSPVSRDTEKALKQHEPNDVLFGYQAK